MTDKKLAEELAEGFKRINKAAMRAVGEGNFPEAISMLREGLALEEKLGLTVQMSESYANIGNVYFSAGEYDEALSCLKKAKEMFAKAGHTEGVISTSLTISTILELNEDYPGAQKQLDAAFRSARTGEHRGMLYYRIACLQHKTGLTQRAQESFSRALIEMERLNRQEDILLCLLARASFFIDIDRQMLASRDIARAKSIARNNDKLMNLFINTAAEMGLDGQQ